jgi:hypothetical protein
MVAARIRKGETWYDMRSHALVTVLAEEGTIGDMTIPYVKLVKIEYLDRETNEICEVYELYLHDAEFARPTMCGPSYQITQDVIKSAKGVE